MHICFLVTFELAVTYLVFNDYTNMQNTLDNISSNFELSTELQADIIDFQFILDLSKSIQQNNMGEGSLTETQIQSLETIMNNDAPLIGAMALSILKRNNINFVFQEQVDDLAQSSSRLMPKPVSKLEENKDVKYKLYPNPSSDYTTVFYYCQNKNINYSISDMQGRVLIVNSLETIENIKQNEALIDLGDLSPGTYQFTIKSNNGIDWSAKLIIK